jgi:hypothetical protein
MDFKSKTLTCQLTTPELQQRRATVIQDIKKLALQKEEIHEGLKFTFPGKDEVLDTLLAFIKTERLCCDFFDFRLSVQNELAVLEISGPAGAGEFLKHELGF